MIETSHLKLGSEQPASLAEVAEGLHGRTQPGSPIRVWLVDDNDDYRGSLAELLAGEEGIECPCHFPSADAALSALASKSGPDVLLLDVEMKGQNGLNAIRPIKSLARSTRVMMLTTFYDSEWHSRALREGASDFLLKTYELEKLVERIRSYDASQAGNYVAAVQSECTALPGFARLGTYCQREQPAKAKDHQEGTQQKTPSNSNWLARRLKFLRSLLN